MRGVQTPGMDRQSEQARNPDRRRSTASTGADGTELAHARASSLALKEQDFWYPPALSRQ